MERTHVAHYGFPNNINRGLVRVVLRARASSGTEASMGKKALPRYTVPWNIEEHEWAKARVAA